MSDAIINADRHQRSVGWGLGIGIFCLPWIFSWFTLRAGHTTKARIFAFIWLAVFLAWTLGGGKEAKRISADNASNAEQALDGGSAAPAPALLGIGSTAKTDYFDVTLKSCQARSHVGTGNEFAEPESRGGTRFLVVEAEFSNTDDESRMIEAGDAFLETDGRKVTFDMTETVILEGWGGLEKVSPMTSYTTKIVYRVPEKSGRFSWRPGRNSDDLTFDCGTQ